MKILHVADFLPELHEVAGGAEFATRRVIDEQVAAGIEIEVATLPVQKRQAVLPWSRHYELAHLDRYAPRLAFAVKQLYYPRDPLGRAALQRVLAQSQPQLVHFHNLHYTGLATLDCARALGIPSVLTIYDYWLFCPSFMLLTNHNQLCRRGHGAHCVDCVGTRRVRFLKPVKRALFAVRPEIFRRCAAAIDRFIVLSPASRDILLEHGITAERIEVIPQYLWQEAAASPRDQRPQRGRLVYVGWVEARKGLHVVIDALARVAADYRELSIEVLGMPANADYAQQIEAAIAAAGLGARVRFHGKLSRHDLLCELQRAYLVLVPEQWENMSPVILTEAMAAGACVLASRVGGIRQFVEEFRTGLLAERDQPAEFATRIRWAMDNPDAITAMGAAARARARELFDPTTITNKTLALYRGLTSRPATVQSA